MLDDIFESWKEEYRRFKEDLEINGEFEDVVDVAYINSVDKEPVNYAENTKTKSGLNVKQILAIGAAALIIVSAGYSFGRKKVESYQTNSIVSEYIDKKYEGIVTCNRTDGNKYVFYYNDKTAEYIMNCPKNKFDEAVYAAWYSMDYNKTENMNAVFGYLPGDDSFVDYLKGKGYVDKDGKIDTAAYSASMKAQIIETHSLGDDAAKGSK